MRLFVAIEVPEPQKLSVQAAIQPLKPALPQARWTPPESWHVTLKFLGEVPEERLAEVQGILEECAARVPPIKSHLTAAGVFPGSRRARVIWIGLDDRDQVFRNLGGRMERKFGKAGFRREARVLRPHLTVARFREPSAAVDLTPFAAGKLDRSQFEVAEAVLFRSRLSPQGASYEAGARFPFRGEPSGP